MLAYVIFLIVIVIAIVPMEDFLIFLISAVVVVAIWYPLKLRFGESDDYYSSYGSKGLDFDNGYREADALDEMAYYASSDDPEERKNVE